MKSDAGGQIGSDCRGGEGWTAIAESAYLQLHSTRGGTHAKLDRCISLGGASHHSRRADDAVAGDRDGAKLVLPASKDLWPDWVL